MTRPTVALTPAARAIRLRPWTAPNDARQLTQETDDMPEPETQYGIKWADDPRIEGPYARTHAERIISRYPQWGGVLVSRAMPEWREVDA